MKVLNYYKNIKTGEIIKKWETESQYCNHPFSFDELWKQCKGDEE